MADGAGMRQMRTFAEVFHALWLAPISRLWSGGALATVFSMQRHRQTKRGLRLKTIAAFYDREKPCPGFSLCQLRLLHRLNGVTDDDHDPHCRRGDAACH